MKKMTIEEVAAKTEWEGGVLATIAYGLKSGDIDDSSPEGKEIKEAWAAAEKAAGAIFYVEELLEDYLP